MTFDSKDKFLFRVSLCQLSTLSWTVRLQSSPSQLVPNLNVTLHRYNVLKYSHILFNTSISHCCGAISCHKRLSTINQTNSIGVFAAALHADCKSVLNQHPALFDFAFFFLKIFFFLFCSITLSSKMGKCLLHQWSFSLKCKDIKMNKEQFWIYFISHFNKMLKVFLADCVFVFIEMRS